MAGADDIDQAAMNAGYVCVGALRGAHGVKGLVKLASFTEEEAALFDFGRLFLGSSFKPLSLRSAGRAGDLLLARVDIISSREEAQRLKGQRIFAKREDLVNSTDEDDFFLVDLIGLEARDIQGAKQGVVKAVEDFGAGDLLEIKLDTPIKGLGRHIFIPFTKALVPSVHLDANFLSIDMDAWQQNQLIAEANDQREEAQNGGEK